MAIKHLRLNLNEPTPSKPSFSEIKRYYEKENCWGLSTSIDAKNCNPELIRTGEAIQEYVIKLCSMLEVKRFQETKIVNFGEEERVAGYSMIQLIETSLVSGHFANATNAAYTIYSAANFTILMLHYNLQKIFFNLKKSLHLCVSDIDLQQSGCNSLWSFTTYATF